jgi:hypothetical protein
MRGSLRDPATLLTCWERAVGAAPVARGAALLDVPLDLPVGECAALAAEAYAQTFGPVVACTVGCGSCGERLELTVDLGALPLPAEPATGGVRAPTTRDLVDAGVSDDPRALLASRCGVVDSATEEAAERLAGAAGRAVVTTCPGCGGQVRCGLDPAQLLAEQVEVAAVRLLGEVAALAAAYGWTEPEVLALPPARRAAYLRLAGR